MNIKTKLILYGLASIIVVSGVSLGIYFGFYYDWKNGQEDNQIVLTLESSTSTRNYTLTDLMNFPNITGYAGYRKSSGDLVGPDLYKGVDLDVLLDDIGGLTSDKELEITAEDDYKVTFTSEMLNGNFPSYDPETGEYLGIGEFHVILAYEVNGVMDIGGSGALRIVCLPKEGENYYTDGSPWVKDVVKLKLVSDESWIVYLHGITNDSIRKSTFEAFMHINDSELLQVYQLQEEDKTNTYEGIALWRIISLFDGEPEGSTINTFNDSLVSLGYNVLLKNFEGKNVTLAGTEIARNDSFILAAKKNSIFLQDNEAPLRLVGAPLNALQMISRIIEIWIILM